MKDFVACQKAIEIVTITGGCWDLKFTNWTSLGSNFSSRGGHKWKEFWLINSERSVNCGAAFFVECKDQRRHTIVSWANFHLEYKIFERQGLDCDLEKTKTRWSKRRTCVDSYRRSNHIPISLIQNVMGVHLSSGSGLDNFEIEPVFDQNPCRSSAS
jgi:hypothetical protein